MEQDFYNSRSFNNKNLMSFKRKIMVKIGQYLQIFLVFLFYFVSSFILDLIFIQRILCKSLHTFDIQTTKWGGKTGTHDAASGLSCLANWSL